MLRYKTLLNKKQINLKKDMISKSTADEESVDLLSVTIDSNSKLSASTYIIVNKYYVARPDLISLALFGTDEYGDIICKMNGISNPFDLNEDMIIAVPEASIVDEICYADEVEKSSQISPEDHIVDLKSEYVFQKKKNEVRSPNMQVKGDQNYITSPNLGFVIY